MGCGGEKNKKQKDESKQAYGNDYEVVMTTYKGGSTTMDLNELRLYKAKDPMLGIEVIKQALGGPNQLGPGPYQEDMKRYVWSDRELPNGNSYTFMSTG